MERLNIGAVATEAFHHYRSHFAELLKVVTLPALAHTAVIFASRQIPDSMLWLNWVALLVMAFIGTLAALSCHRVILLGSQSVPPLGVSGTQLRDWKFIGTALLLYFIFAALYNIVYLVAHMSGPLERGTTAMRISVALAYLSATYLLSRLAVRLPAVSIDQPLRMKQSWQLTRRNGIQLLILVGGLPWSLHVAQHTIAGIFDSDVDYLSVKAVLFWLLFPLQIALLSVSYLRLVSKER